MREKNHVERILDCMENIDVCFEIDVGDEIIVVDYDNARAIFIDLYKEFGGVQNGYGDQKSEEEWKSLYLS